MVKREYNHYICDYCGNEIVEKTKDDTSKWIVISRSGGNSFTENERLMISYMKPGWNTYGNIGFKQKLISTNLTFCCKECLLKFILKQLDEPEDISGITIPVGTTKPVSRFDGIETTPINAEDNNG